MNPGDWALVTGAGKRVGRALALAAAEAGYLVAVHVHRSLADGETVAAEIRAKGGNARVVQGDLALAETPERLIAEASSEGCLTLLVNNAALFDFDRIATIKPERFDAQLAVNLRAPLFLAQAFAAALPADGRGQIVNLADQRTRHLNANFLSYSLSKVGLDALTRILAVDLAPRIRVNAIAPGLPLPAPSMSSERAERLVQETPLKTGGSPAAIAAALTFLLTADAVTGETIAVDGGAHLGRG